MKQVEVLLPAAAPHGFDYCVPEGMALKAGDIVSVPLGRGQSLGVVWGAGKADIPAGKLRPVTKRHDEFPSLSDAMREFIDWAAWYNCASPGMVLKMALPVKDIGKEGRKRPHPTPLPHAGEGSERIALAGEGFHLAKLSDVQRLAAQQIEHKVGQGFLVTLLDGVTGSGKTEVYFDAMAHALAAGDTQILVLLPEIALSVQWLERFHQRFGFKPVVWNSEITPAQKREAWKAIAKGEARVVVGARSALFLPYRNLKLLVVDEEHDASYKQEDGVVYHARDMAVARGRFEKFPVVLVSATPSLESFYNARQGKYAELSLPKRHAGAELPEVEMLDMREVKTERGSFVSEPLREALRETLACGHQSMLFLNRRGYAPVLLCRKCNHWFECPQCSSWLVLHRKQPRLECHHCNYHIPVPSKCPACGTENSLAPCGPGVERVREEVEAFLPQARIAVMASDQTESYKDMSDLIKAMEEGKIDILIGTQMIAKGHHFAGLSVVGVVDADLGLAGGELRAAERTYQLLHQISGRAGREKIAGKVYLQSYQPDHPVMQALVSGDREAFLQAELAARKNANMPPFSRLAAIIIEGAKEEAAMKTAKQLAFSFPATGHQSPVTLLGPAPAPLYRLRGKYRWRLLVKADRSVNLPDFVKAWVESVEAPSSVRVKVDIDPVGFL